MPIDCDLVSPAPAPIYMGELPESYLQAPARVIINACGALPTGAPCDVTLLSLPMLDVLDEALIPARDRLEQFLDDAHRYASREPTYWHCHAGLNRSGFVLAAYLHRHRALRISDAITALRAARSPMVLCNNVFERTLRTWYGGADEQRFEKLDLDTYLRERQRRRDRGLEQ